MKYAKESVKTIHGYSKGLLKTIKEYSWPGNIRELNNKIKRAIAICEGKYLLIKHISEKKGSDMLNLKGLDYKTQIERLKQYCSAYENEHGEKPSKKQTERDSDVSRQHIINFCKEDTDLNNYFESR